jgi:hypothetical protein
MNPGEKATAPVGSNVGPDAFGAKLFSNEYCSVGGGVQAAGAHRFAGLAA